MKFLALDTSTKKAVIVLRVDDKVFFSAQNGIKHAEVLSTIVDSLFNFAGLKPCDVDFFAVGVGPGSLTGLRVGIGQVLGLSASCDEKIVEVPSLDLIRRNYSYERKVLVVRKARLGWVYYAVYNGKDVVEGPAVDRIEVVKERFEGAGDLFIIGDGKEDFGVALGEFDYPTAEALDQYVTENWENQKNYWEIKPLYLQKSIAELNWERRVKGEGHDVQL